MKTGILSKTLFCLLALAGLGLLFGANTASAQGPEGVRIFGKQGIFIPGGAPPDKSYGTLFKRRGDIQRFEIRNGGGFCWNLTLFLPANFSIARGPTPNPLNPGTTSEVIITYNGGNTPAGSTFAMLFVDCDDPLHAHFYVFGLDNTPKKVKTNYEGSTRNLKIRDASGTTKVPTTPITLNLPLGRGAFNGVLRTAESNFFTQNVRFQGRVQNFKMRQGGKKMLMDGLWRWKLERLGFPGRSMGKFKWTVKTNAQKETIISGNINATNQGKSGPKSKTYSLRGRFRATLEGVGGGSGTL